MCTTACFMQASPYASFNLSGHWCPYRLTSCKSVPHPSEERKSVVKLVWVYSGGLDLFNQFEFFCWLWGTSNCNLVAVLHDATADQILQGAFYVAQGKAMPRYGLGCQVTWKCWMISELTLTWYLWCIFVAWFRLYIMYISVSSSYYEWEQLVYCQSVCNKNK